MVNDEPPPTSVGPLLVGAINDINRAAWPVVPGLRATLRIAVYGLSLLAMIVGRCSC